MVQEKYSRAEALYAKIKEEVCQRALALDEAFSQSTQVRRGAREVNPPLTALWNRGLTVTQPRWDWNVVLFPP